MRVRHLNLSRPQHSLALQAPLAAGAGGIELCVREDGGPVFRDKNGPDYQRIFAALSDGVVLRDQPGVEELLSARKVQAR